jgi:hypothetical protein
MRRPTRRMLLMSGALLIAGLVGIAADPRAGVVVGILLVGIILVA